MIGVIANPAQEMVIREFFELFKTPWEFYRNNKDYEVLVCTDGARVLNNSATLIVIYGGTELPIDATEKALVISSTERRMLMGDGVRLPIYRKSVSFAVEGGDILTDEDSRQVVAHIAKQQTGAVVVRIGYDLCDEVTALLTEGQPCENASIPALDFHIAVLRNLIIESGVSLVEIPAVPHGYSCIACLTHDVDHPSIRRHKFDHTMFGFLYRAAIRSFVDALSRRVCWQTLWANWMAVLKLPLVHLGLADDFWNQMHVYTKLEGGPHSSFFVIPFENCRGIRQGRPAPSRRASAYGAADIASEIGQLLSQGHEIGLHGIDAWHDSSKGREELDEFRRVTGVQKAGGRMHWLYFDERSPAVLESIGLDYDSTVGYNEAVGYRVGTAQVYKPLEATTLLELPLHVMDTALFLPHRQNLSASEARMLIDAIIEHAVRHGGVVTVNWHDRSIAPERLWRGFYVALIDELKRKGAWLANARDTVEWFRARRAASFDNFDSRGAAGLPGLCLRVHNARTPTISIFSKSVS